MSKWFDEKTTFDTPCGKCGKIIVDGRLFVFGGVVARRLGTPTGIICPRCLGAWADAEIEEAKEIADCDKCKSRICEK